MTGIVAAGHIKTAEAAAAMLRTGGNAFDAAVAGVLAACVAESVLTSLGGGGFLLAHTAAGHNVLFDFFSQTPKTALKPGQSLDFYPIEANFGDTTQTFHIGLGSMAVPGVWAGLLRVHQRLGRLPLAVVAEPAISLARQGVTVNPFLAYVYQVLRPILTANPATQAIYAPTGQLLQAGDRLYLSSFADTLSHLVAHPDDFYHGDIARQIAQACADRGGYLTQADLDTYQVRERAPLQTEYRGRTLLTNPPPSSGGTLIAFALQLLSAAELGSYTHGSAAHLRCLSTVMQLTNTARREGYDARLYDPTVAADFLSAQNLAPYQQQLTTPVNKLGSTTHLSVIDSQGNAASVTTSNGEGSAYVVPGTGIMINNMLGEADLNPHGFHQWQPHQRISSMMAPTLVLQHNQPEVVLGSGGSNRIRTAILQVISNLIDFGMPLPEAVTAPRIHWENNLFHLEPAPPLKDTKIKDTELTNLGELIRWSDRNMFFGGVHAVSPQAGAGDPRRHGAVIKV
ncbi:MAG: gamma-glutamyltransferase [Cyanobacteria bacterium P01_A01_bin.105]